MHTTDSPRPANPPAFPTGPTGLTVDREVITPEGQSAGMTLRDYFAAHALQALLGLSSKGELAHIGDAEDDELARWAYETAEAMLRARASA